MLLVWIIWISHEGPWRNGPHVYRIISEGIEDEAFLPWNRDGYAIILPRRRQLGGILRTWIRSAVGRVIPDTILNISDTVLLGGRDILPWCRVRVTSTRAGRTWRIGNNAGTHQSRDERQQKKNILVVHGSHGVAEEREKPQFAMPRSCSSIWKSQAGVFFRRERMPEK